MHLLQTFISGFANIAKQLTKLTETNQSFQSTPEAEGSFQTLKRALCRAPILANHRPGGRFILYLREQISNPDVTGVYVLFAILMFLMQRIAEMHSGANGYGHSVELISVSGYLIIINSLMPINY
jgi:hypothetical protein